MAKNVLLICGSLNQTTIMHKISKHLRDENYYFTPFYSEGLIDILAKRGLLDFSILGGRHRQDCLHYLHDNDLPIDERGTAHDYDLVVTGTDLLIQKNIRGKRIVLVQEGLMDPENLLYHVVRYLNLPRYLVNTAATGLSDGYDIFVLGHSGTAILSFAKVSGLKRYA